MNKTIFTCSKCDAQYPKWAGRCLECGEWGSIAENTNHKTQSTNKKQISSNQASKNVVNFSNFSVNHKMPVKFSSGFKEFDQVLGAGITPGSLILLGGDPGVGKSTLALQLASGINQPVLYVSAEESVEQVAEKLNRLSSGQNKKLQFLNEDNLETVIATIYAEKPSLVVIDSIQTVYSQEIKNPLGNINQIKACTAQLMAVAKQTNIAIIIIGHVTKEGELAGPKTMEHLVDTVLYLEGDKYKQYRLLRSQKNRFGPTDEVAILEMAKDGLRPVINPSRIFLEEAHFQPGSVIAAVAEGSQIFLVEVQALVSKSSFGYPKRSASGFDQKRLELLSTVIAKKTNINLANFDIFINIAGGLTLREPALDLAVVLSIISSYQNQTVPAKTVVFGEVGLAGEVRTVAKTKERIKESLRMGFDKIVLPAFETEVKGVNLVKIREIKELVNLLVKV